MVLKKSTKYILTSVLVVAALVLLFMLDNGMIGTSYTVRIVRLSFIYALIGVSMNLVNKPERTPGRMRTATPIPILTRWKSPIPTTL